jgi:hypothetical protein
MIPPFDEHRHSALWSAVADTLSELLATGEITVHTAPDYVIGYLCRELTAKGLVNASGTGERR